MSQLVIPRCYDSHVHWYFTGDIPDRLDLKPLKSLEDVSRLKVKTSHYRGKWLTGFGWDSSHWPQGQLPNKETLDRVFPSIPVCFSQADGHAIWVNSKALQLAGLMSVNEVTSLPGGSIGQDTQGNFTGVFVDDAMDLVKKHIPPPTAEQVTEKLKKGIQRFHSFGVTHIRDLSCTESQWNASVHLYEQHQLNLAVEQFLPVSELGGFEKALDLAHRISKEAIPNIKSKGIKFYYDGALGSEGALISGHYCSGSGQGLSLSSPKELKENLIKTWEQGLIAAVHVIGDEAFAQVTEVAVSLWQKGYVGELNLEHAELARTESIQKLKGHSVKVYMQPCHWLQDRHWLQNKYSNPKDFIVFPWAEIERNNIPIYFGSDSPISPPNPLDNQQALAESSMRGIEKPQNEWSSYQSHPDATWFPASYSKWKKNQLIETVFNANQHAPETNSLKFF